MDEVIHIQTTKEIYHMPKLINIPKTIAQRGSNKKCTHSDFFLELNFISLVFTLIMYSNITQLFSFSYNFKKDVKFFLYLKSSNK